MKIWGFWRAQVIAVVAFVSPWGAHSQQTPAEAPILWRSLQTDDTPEAAKTKLEAMAEVARVKNIVKKGAFARQDINMMEGGIPIFEGHFSIETGYRDARLSIVRLTSGRGCVNSGHPLASKIEGELLKKYPSAVSRLIDSSTFNLRAFDATSLEPVHSTSIYLGDDVAALFRINFYREDPPKYYGGSAINRSVYNLARSMYDNRASACGGMGYLTSELEISYIPRRDYESLLRDVQVDDAVDREKAADNL